MDILIQHKSMLIPMTGIIAIMLGATVIFLSIRSTTNPEPF